MIRIFDIVFSFFGLLILTPLLVILTVVVWCTIGSPFFRQARVGRGRRQFTLIKFRTMRPGTADLPTHLVAPSAVTPLGRFLRRTKLDELPQLWNVLLGQMSLVGPRPGLPSQHDLTAARDSAGVFLVRPGITGLAQIRGVDMSTPELLARTDAWMIRRLDLCNYFTLLFLTVIGRGRGDGVN